MTIFTLIVIKTKEEPISETPCVRDIHQAMGMTKNISIMNQPLSQTLQESSGLPTCLLSSRKTKNGLWLSIYWYY